MILKLLLPLLLLAAGPAAAREVSGPITGTVRWQGEIAFEKAVRVPRGATLEIAGGTRVRPLAADAGLVVQGTLLVQGTEEKPVEFAVPSGWGGIRFHETSTESALHFVRISGAETAVSSIAADFSIKGAAFRECQTAVKLLREAEPTIEDSLFIDNAIAVDNEMRSAPVIRGNRFAGHTKTAILASHNSTGRIENNVFENNKQAVGLLQKYPDRIVANRFAGNETGIYCNQTKNTPLIADNTFENNGKALVNFAFSYPKVKNNVFTGNETAVHNDQYGSPGLFHNRFRDNGTALYNYRKSNPKVEKNVFERNTVALYCDYSSYPQVKENNFLANDMAVKLGIYQSADWEKRSGSKAIIMRKAKARRSQNPLLAKAPTEFNDFVDVTGNWWGEDTGLLRAAGPKGDVAMFHDRRDQPEVSYEGFGDESYALDRVKFSPWLEKPVSDAGPERK